jgi:hypothetical protein
MVSRFYTIWSHHDCLPGCESVFNDPMVLYSHFVGDHDDSDPMKALPQTKHPHLPAVVSSPRERVPAYMVEAYEIQGARMSRQRHELVAPWVRLYVFMSLQYN